MAGTDELACVYASLILADDDVEVTADKISAILKAASVSVEPFWPGMFAKFLEGNDIKSLVSNIGAGGPAPAATAGAAAGGDAGAGGAKEEEKKKEPEPESESDDDMGFGLFD
uniref:Large ribosomal subunit protein P1 n=1 Tax=Barentsia elongata TaxID=478378 RepID=A8UAB6_9BILA|nr:putative ribosomal protein P1 [Barentsia elongata]